MSELVKDLCGKYFPSEAAPLGKQFKSGTELRYADIVLPIVYTDAAVMAASTPAGWASEALLEGGVPLRECWEAVMGLHDQVSPFGQEFLRNLKITARERAKKSEPFMLKKPVYWRKSG